MNCSACGSPLQFDRIVFHCSCGAYVHAYCFDKHIVEAHRPEFDEGYADLNGEFHPKHKPVAPPPELPGIEVKTSSEDQDQDEQGEVVTVDLVPDEALLEESTGEGVDTEADEDR